MASWKPQSDFYIELISILALQLALMMFFYHYHCLFGKALFSSQLLSVAVCFVSFT